MRRNSQRRMRRSFHGMRRHSQRMRRSSHGMRRNSQRVMRRPLQRKKWNPQRVAFFFVFFWGGVAVNSRRAWVREITTTTTSQHGPGPQSTANSRLPRLHKRPLLTPTRNINMQQRRAWRRAKENRIFTGGRECFGAHALAAAAATPTALPAAHARSVNVRGEWPVVRSPVKAGARAPRQQQ